MGMKLNFTNLIAFPLIIGIGIDDGVHLIHRYRMEGWQRIGTVFANTGKAILLTSLTTMIGFGSLMFMTHRGMASMGTVLVIGIGSCLITTVLILSPAFRVTRFSGSKSPQ
ncbi:MMPL family transporter [Candidatus Poribacteria bacterium]|nr:MMPL family transporter [Candidatus Poribacteria bacterium]